MSSTPHASTQPSLVSLIVPPLKVLRLEQAAVAAGVLARDHERAAAAIVQRLRIARARRDTRLDHLEDEQAVPADEARIDEGAFEAGEALADQRRRDLAGGAGREAEFRELVDVAPGRV